MSIFSMRRSCMKNQENISSLGMVRMKRLISYLTGRTFFWIKVVVFKDYPKINENKYYIPYDGKGKQNIEDEVGEHESSD